MCGSGEEVEGKEIGSAGEVEREIKKVGAEEEVEGEGQSTTVIGDGKSGGLKALLSGLLVPLKMSGAVLRAALNVEHAEGWACRDDSFIGGKRTVEDDLYGLAGHVHGDGGGKGGGLLNGGDPAQDRGGGLVSGNAESGEIEASGPGVGGAIQRGEVQLNGELPGEGLSVIRCANCEEASAPGNLEKGFSKVGESLL